MRALFGLLALVTLGFVAAGIHMYWAVHAPVNPAAAELKVFTVPKGASVQRVGELLKHEGMLRSAFALRLYLRIAPNSPSPKAGRHQVSARMNTLELLHALSTPPLSDDVPLAMVEGWRLTDADAWLSAHGWITSGAYLDAARAVDRHRISFAHEGSDFLGYLLPDTYLVPPGTLNVEALIERQLDAFAKKFAEPHADEIKASGRSLRQIVIMASLLEREEPVAARRPQVAGVLYRRFDSGTPLGVDATSRFNLVDWNDRSQFLRALRDPEDPYNTRLRPGLPPGPIGAPGLDSLLAALRPEPSPYWYYLHDAQKNIHFARTAAEHEANRKRYNVW